MKKKRIGSTDIYVSPLTLGCMSLGTDKMKAIDMIHRALDVGINHLDTADLYDFGVNEEIIGEAIKYKREKIVLTTKVGNHFDKITKTWYWDPSKKYIESAVHDSLRRLQTDYIDLYLLHGGTIGDNIDETIEAFERLKKSGIIRAYGISSIRPNVIYEYVHRSNMDAVMMQYSILDRRPEQLFHMLDNHQISLLSRGPLAKGMLSNKAIKQVRKKGEEGLLQYSKMELIQIIHQLLQLNQPMTKLAFQYVLKDPTVASAVFGVSTMKQLNENINYNNISELNDKLYEYIKTVSKPLQYTEHQIE